MASRPLTVAWCTYFPAEWLPDAPESVRRLPKRHPASWQQAGAAELGKIPGVRLHVIELRKELEKDEIFVSGNYTVHCVKVPGGMRAPTLFWLDTWLLRRKFREIKPDVVHAWGTEKGAAMAASRLRCPYLVSLQGLLGFYASIVPVNRYERFASKLEWWSLRRAKVASGESSFVVDWLRRHHPHLQVHHVEHSPSFDFYRVRRQPSVKPIQFLFVGTMSFRKGMDVLLKALDRLRSELDFRLTIIALPPSPEYLSALKAQTSPALWERIEILRLPPASVILEHMGRATMVLCPTRADTGPVAVKEAVVAGVPVLGSRMGGIPDYIEPGRNGLMFNPGDVEALVQSIREACRHPAFSAGQVDAGALGRVREHLSPAAMAEGFLSIYRGLVPGA